MLKKVYIVFTILMCQIIFAQEKKVTGTVTDNVEPLPGVSILVKGTVKGVETDFDGNYSIVVKQGDVLVFSFVGMETVEKTVGTSNKINVVLKTAKENVLEEVVVTGITQTDKRLFTGSATKLKAENVKVAGLPDVSRSLEGKAAGVSVQNVSGTFGASPKIRIRGATSIYGASKPLWVVDGVVMEDVVDISPDVLASGDAATLISSAIAGLNPDDIESFDVLKDGSATSIYGARAMAGVIVITTKKGRSGHSKISYNSSFTYRSIPKYSDFNIMNSQEHMSVLQELENKGRLSVTSIINAKESGIYGDFYRKIYKVNPDGTFVIKNSELGKEQFLRQAEYRNTNWFKELFIPNVLQTHSISFSSGTDKAQYYGSLSAMVDPGWTKASKVNRFTGNFNSTFDIYDDLKLNVISNASLVKQKAPGTVSSRPDGVTGRIKRDFDINPYSYALNTSRTLDPKANYTRNYTNFNIIKELEENYIDINTVNLKFQSELKYKVNSKINVTALGALKYIKSEREHNITEFSNQANAYRAMGNARIRDENPFLYKDPDNPYALPISVMPKGGMLLTTNNDMFGYDLRSTLSYKDVFNDIHTVNAYVGAELNSIDKNQKQNENYGVQFDNAKTPYLDYKWFKKAAEENNYYYGLGSSRTRMLSYYGTFTYSYDRKYTLNGTIRYEGTNRLGKSRKARWLPTWNISGAWNVASEKFFDNIRNVVSNLTLKSSYSLTADRGPWWVSNSLVDVRTANPWRPSSTQKETAIYIRALENSELTYEKKTELNFGLEAGFFDNRIGLTFDWYKRNNYDLIGAVFTQGLGGESSKFGNVASMKSNGLELSLSTTNIKTKDFMWKTDFIYSHTSNEITDLESASNVFSYVRGIGYRKGYARGSVFSIPFKGLNSDGLPTYLNEKGETTIHNIDLQDIGSADFLEYSGTLDPTDVGSFGNTFKYKNLTLNVFTTYSFGNVIRLDPAFSSEINDYGTLPKELKDRWVVPGDENRTTIPVIPEQRMVTRIGKSQLRRAYNLYNYSTERIAKGDFVRLKEVSLAFDFPKQVLDNLKLKQFSVKLQATNMFLLYSDKKLNGQDPEFTNSGGVATPVPKQITLTFNLSI